jgi:hypothetical protein
MASLENFTVEIRVADFECFEGLVKALAVWLREAEQKAHLSDAERRLLNAALELD